MRPPAALYSLLAQPGAGLTCWHPGPGQPQWGLLAASVTHCPQEAWQRPGDPSGAEGEPGTGAEPGTALGPSRPAPTQQREGPRPSRAGPGHPQTCEDPTALGTSGPSSGALSQRDKPPGSCVSRPRPPARSQAGRFSASAGRGMCSRASSTRGSWGGQGWAPGSPAREGGGVSEGDCPCPTRRGCLGFLGGRGYNSQLRRRIGQTRRLHRERVAATPTPPVTATITQW